MKMKRVFVIILILLTIIINTGHLHASNKIFQIKNGRFDLTELDFTKGESVKLDGRWQFFWNQLIEPNGFSKSFADEKGIFFPVPGYWDKNSTNTQKFNTKGYATYRLVIETNSKDTLLALRIPRILSAYKLWVNGKLMTSCGKVARDSANSVGQSKPSYIVFYNDRDNIEIVLQVSNFVENRGGIIGTFLLGDSTTILKGRDKQIMTDMFIFGYIFIMACYHLILFIFRRKEISSLFLGLSCIFTGIRAITSGEHVLLQLFYINESTFFRLVYINAALGATAFLTFFYTLYLHEFSRKLLKVFYIFNLGSILFIAIVGANTPANLILFIECVWIFEGLYAIYAIISALVHRRQGAFIILSGTIIFILTLINDILRTELIVNTPALSPMGLSVFILAQSIVLAIRFSRVFNNVEELSEKIVSQEILIENERLTSLSQLIGGIAHNIKTPLMSSSGGILIIKKNVDEMVQLIKAKGEYDKYKRSTEEIYLWIDRIRQYLKYMGDIISAVKGQTVKAISNSDLSYKLNDLVTKVDLLMNYELKKNNCILEKRLLYNENLVLKGDVNSLVQVFNNLITNAIESYDGNGGIIVLEIVIENNSVVFSVSDNGKGIPLDIQKKLFKKMTTTKGSNGTGLGLYISYSIIKAKFNGNMSFVSKVGEGTRFVVSIPIRGVNGDSEKSK
ncbi:MAG: ATP-binding protein [Bacillota bacterium]